MKHNNKRPPIVWPLGLCMLACLLAWPVAVVIGWSIGDRDQIFLRDSIWNGPFPVTNSPGWQLIALTLIPYGAGAYAMFARPRNRRGYTMVVGSAAAAGVLSWLLAFAINAM